MIGMEENKEVKLEQDVAHDDKDEHKKEKRNKHKEQVEKLESEIKELKDKLLRNAAELENFKKRMQAERIQDRKYASKTLISDILSPLEQLSMAVNMKTENDLLKNFLIGFKMINDSLFNVLQADGLKEIDALNKPFDPNLHYAIEKEHDPVKPNGTNIAVISKGYMYKDQLLRPTMVKINEWSEEHGKNE
jgi:molecular chaperone GrpE